MKKYYLSVGAIFKNESHILKEWLDHYLVRGVEHFYLINDSSNDNYYNVLEPYIKLGLVTLFDCAVTESESRQEIAYNFYFKLIENQTFWLVILDLDEFLYGTIFVDISTTLREFESYSQLLIKPKEFGSSGFVNQPTDVVSSFTWRRSIFEQVHNSIEKKEILLNQKPIVKTSDVRSYWVHNCEVIGQTVVLSRDILTFNHYRIQSLRFYLDVKTSRGDACFQDNKRDIDTFYNEDYKDEEDFCLINQNNDQIISNKYKFIETLIKSCQADLGVQNSNLFESNKNKVFDDVVLYKYLLVLNSNQADPLANFEIGNFFLSNEMYFLALYFYNKIKIKADTQGVYINKNFAIKKLADKLDYDEKCNNTFSYDAISHYLATLLTTASNPLI